MRKTKTRFTESDLKAHRKEEKAAGVDKEFRYNPERMSRVDKTRVAKPEDLDPRNIKLIITVRIDSDIVDFFKKRAQAPGAHGYQTQMNDALRAFMEGRHDLPAEAATLLGNETFIKAVADKVRRRDKKTA
jgi:uncharacterized protein (DUF4415 family)